QSENLLKFVSGQPGIKLRAHLCHRDCDQLRSNPDLLHLKDFQRIKPGSVTGWEENLIAVDENAELRREMKEKTDKKEKKEKEAAEESSQSGESKKAKKPLEALYGNTGLDPDSKKRKRIVARMKKKLKKAKTSSSSSSASSSTSTSEGETVEDDLLQDRSKLQKIATMAPGVLAASSLQTMKSYIMQSSGNPWHLEEGSLPPVLSQYARQYLLGKASGGIRREIETLVCIGDYLLLGRAAEACDCLVQRVKSLEMTLAGQSWATSQKLEIIPNVDAGVASRAELQLAQKEAALDMKAKGSSAKEKLLSVGEKRRRIAEGEKVCALRDTPEDDGSERKKATGGCDSKGSEDAGRSSRTMQRKGEDCRAVAEGVNELPVGFHFFRGGAATPPGSVHESSPDVDEGTADDSQGTGLGRANAGKRLEFVGENVSKLQKQVLEGLLPACKRVCEWTERLDAFSWHDFFCVRGVDYKGDEILNAQWIRWENVSPALPVEIGGVELEKVVELGSHHYALNFDTYLLAPEDQVYVRPPRVMVAPECWDAFCDNMLQRGVFSMVHEDEIYRVQDKPLLNGLFGVSKHEFEGNYEVMRVIMNLVPVNAVCRGLDSDIATLPSISGMTPLELLCDEDLVISSEDVRCFFYIFKIPPSWHRFMAFNRPLPARLCGDKPGVWYPCSSVLPMGFKNSVALAQHVHRVIAKKALVRCHRGGEVEMRKDRSFTTSNPLMRIYLDNFDELRKVSKGHAEAIAGHVSPLVSSLREEYALLKVPRHPRKGVASQTLAEVQGAVVDGKAGIAYPKQEKVLRYAYLTRLVLEAGEATQKQMQIVGGGLVYLAMFRRPLLGSLNAIWTFICSFEGFPPVVKLKLPEEVREELARFLGLIPLAYMDFRCRLSSLVTASDASTTGGGVTASNKLSPAGCVAAQCPVRGDVVEPTDITGVLTVGLFDGISGLRVAADVLGWNVMGHISVERSPEAARVVESRFPNTIHVSNVQDITGEMVKDWSLKFSQVGLILLGAGPPCQGVSGLNAARKGALRDERSAVFQHVPRVRDLLKAAFPWAQVQTLMESVASMDQSDEEIMSASFGATPWYIDAGNVSLAHRPRLYWTEWELVAEEDATLDVLPSGLNPNLRVQDLVERTAPGSETDFQTYLQRPMMGSCRRVGHLANELKLVRKLCTLISIKGDDLLIQPSTDDQVKYQRLRASIPSKLWKWRTICGWTWSQQAEHINVLELRAVLTALRWRIERKGITHSKFVHLVDSLVCLHALSRGRSSSRKLKRTLLRINSLLLATNSHVLWAYVNTKDNPADAPSRRPRKRKWSNA
ncbi:unnamed protein product, partial [Cladocopium goreaui]